MPLPKDQLLPHMAEFGAVLGREWAGRPPDLVHAHFWMSGLASLRGAAGLPVPVAQTFHALGSVKARYQGVKDTSPRERVSAEREIGLSCDQIIATCHDEVRELARLGIPTDKMSVVPCGVDTGAFWPARWPPGVPPACCSTLGLLVERKGIDTAIDALPQLPGVELVVAGGPERDLLPRDAEYRRLRGIARDRGVSDRVVFTGAVPRTRVPALIRSADVVVCTPWYEPFGHHPAGGDGLRRAGRGRRGRGPDRQRRARDHRAADPAPGPGGAGDRGQQAPRGPGLARRVRGRRCPAGPPLVFLAPGRGPDRECLRQAGRGRAAGPGHGSWPVDGGGGCAMTPGEASLRLAGPGIADTGLADTGLADTGLDPGLDESGPGESELTAHLDQLIGALRSPQTGLRAARRWGRLLAAPLTTGHRLLVAGNGGSAAEAQHLTAELVGRYVADRPPLSAIALHAETSSLTAIGNDFGPAEAFARQVAAHGRAGDTLLLLSASGRSENVLAAAYRARSLGIRVWAMTGPSPNPLATAADDAICVAAPDTATVQEVHLVAIHAMCDALDAEVTPP